MVVANKADLDGAMELEEIRKNMDLPKNIPIIPVVAEEIPISKEKLPARLKEEDIHKVFDSLFETII